MSKIASSKENIMMILNKMDSKINNVYNKCSIVNDNTFISARANSYLNDKTSSQINNFQFLWGESPVKYLQSELDTIVTPEHSMYNHNTELKPDNIESLNKIEITIITPEHSSDELEIEDDDISIITPEHSRNELESDDTDNTEFKFKHDDMHVKSINVESLLNRIKGSINDSSTHSVQSLFNKIKSSNESNLDSINFTMMKSDI